MTTPIAKEQLRRLLPHAGEMCLLDTVESWDDTTIRCMTQTHLQPQHPLRMMAGTHRIGHRSDKLSSVHLVEYAAQAMAIHGTLLANRDQQSESVPRVQPGRIGALRDVKFHVAALDDLNDVVVIEARRRLANSDGLIYEFTARHHQQLLCEGRVIIALSPAPEALNK
jgi:predicted hotdog family 3-hydroxylacyl-ACP dehydratase